jgi:SAM-dependent MidA family methyltransferase
MPGGGAGTTASSCIDGSTALPLTSPWPEAREGEPEEVAWAQSERRLVEAIRDEILAAPDRRITFARFMQRALTDPGLGYYATSEERPTRGGDFLTAPELHPLFGRCVGRHLEAEWQALGRPGRFVVREWGAGRGTLAGNVAEGLRADGSPLADRLSWQPVDVAGRYGDVPGGPFDGVVLANEFVDALPVHRVIQRSGRLLELYVTWRAGWLGHEEGEPSSPDLEAHLAAEGVTLAEGQLAEVCLAAGTWVACAVRDLARGELLVIDYGHEAAELYGPRRMAGSLVTYRSHVAGDDPFVAVGRSDLTAHVDLSALDRAARAAGLSPVLRLRQAEFLADLGLGELLAALGRDRETRAEEYLAARASVVRLLDPRHLGGFQVRSWRRDPTPSGTAATEGTAGATARAATRG